MGKRINIIGKRFGRLVVLSLSRRDGYTKYYLCRCDCGVEKEVAQNNLTTGKVVSCGCYRLEAMRDYNRKKQVPKDYIRLGHIFSNMRDRCYNENCSNYDRYGGRGVYICDEWLNDIDKFRSWAMENGYEKGLTIDRIDNDGPYAPWNCRWATNKEQTNNTSRNVFIEFNGERKTLSGWAEALNMPISTLRNRVCEHGWSVERALTEPIRHRKK